MLSYDISEEDPHWGLWARFPVLRIYVFIVFFFAVKKEDSNAPRFLNSGWVWSWR